MLDRKLVNEKMRIGRNLAINLQGDVEIEKYMNSQPICLERNIPDTESLTYQNNNQVVRGLSE